MKGTLWTTEHERLAAATTPELAASSDAEVDRIWNRVATTMVTAPRPRRHRWRLALAALAGALVLGSASVATAQLYSAHTGRGPIDAEDLRLGGPGERLDPSAPDFASVVAAEVKDIPFPNATARELAVAFQVRDGARSGDNVSMSTGALRAWLADAAMCAWSNQWAAAIRDGDAGAQADAVAAVLSAPSWDAVTAIDPSPYSKLKSQRVTGLDGVTRTEQYRDESQFYWLGALGEAIQGDDVAAVAAVLAQHDGYCQADLVPDIPTANGNYVAPDGQQ